MGGAGGYDISAALSGSSSAGASLSGATSSTGGNINNGLSWQTALILAVGGIVAVVFAVTMFRKGGS
jgi:hypothetical protein